MDNEFKVLDEYFRVVNYLSCAMIYLKDNNIYRCFDVLKFQENER